MMTIILSSGAGIDRGAPTWCAAEHEPARTVGETCHNDSSVFDVRNSVQDHCVTVVVSAEGVPDFPLVHLWALAGSGMARTAAPPRFGVPDSESCSPPAGIGDLRF